MLCLVMGFSPVLPCGNSPPSLDSVTRARFLMGTVFRFEAPSGEDREKTGRALEAALDEVDRLEQVLSNWREGSELSRLNRRAEKGPVTVSRDLFDAVREALRWAEETNGAFDPTVEPWTRRFRAPTATGEGGPAPGEDLPSPLRGGWRRVHLNPGGRTIRFAKGVLGLDLGGIGKGYALDRAAALLRSRGLEVFLLDAGGQVLAAGGPPGKKGWLIGVADPEDRDLPAMPLVLRDASAATSGNSQRKGEILDPTTGRPVSSAGSATAVAPEAASADALSTALFVLGPREGARWAAHRQDLFAVYLNPGDRPPFPPCPGGGRPGDPGDAETLSIASIERAGRRILDVRVGQECAPAPCRRDPAVSAGGR